MIAAERRGGCYGPPRRVPIRHPLRPSRRGLGSSGRVAAPGRRCRGGFGLGLAAWVGRHTGPGTAFEPGSQCSGAIYRRNRGGVRRRPVAPGSVSPRRFAAAREFPRLRGSGDPCLPLKTAREIAANEVHALFEREPVEPGELVPHFEILVQVAEEILRLLVEPVGLDRRFAALLP